MNHHPISAAIIEENNDEAQRIKKLIEKECSNIIISNIGTNPCDTKKIIYNTTYDIIIMNLDTGRKFAFQILKEASFEGQEKELILISSEEESTWQKISNTAVDYITKPYTHQSVFDAIEKAKKHIKVHKAVQNSKRLKNDSTMPLHIIAIPSVDDVKILKTDDILYIKSEGRYSTFFTTQNKKHTASTNLGYYEKKLLHNAFLRIHNSYLVNTEHIVNIHKRDGIYVEMSNKDTVPVAKRKKDILFEFLGL